jgi:hypothetical protein
MSKFLTTDQEAYNRLQNLILTFSEIYTDAAKELVNLDVKGYKAENLTNGGFLTIFHEYHKAEHAQPEWSKLKISYEKYLNLKEIDLKNLEHLEFWHKERKDFETQLYDTNHSFFSFADNKTRDSLFQNIMKLAPEKRVYRLFNLLSFKGNTVKVEIPKKPFEIHALNKLQIDLLQDIKDYVNASRKLGLEYRDILKVVKDYVKWTDGRPTGLSNDLKNIEFSYNQILNKRL